MAASTTISFTKSGQSLFTSEEVRHLMRVEFDRASRHKYPITCMMILVDRLESLHTVHGYESKMEVLQAMVELLKRETRASDFLGCLVDDRLLAVFPHTGAESARFLAKRILDGARALEFGREGQTLRVSASIGLAHNMEGGAQSFDTLLRVAEEGLAVADAGGGDRFIETELYQLYENRLQKEAELEPDIALVQRFAEQQREEREEELPAPPQVVERAPTEEEVEAAARRMSQELLAQELRKVEEQKAQELQRVEEQKAEELQRLVDQRARELQLAEERKAQEHSSQEQDHNREIEVLQRRIAKLTTTLDSTEEELSRVREEKQPDEGVASIYDSVQGLSPEDERTQMKHKLMCLIFEENLALQGKISA